MEIKLKVNQILDIDKVLVTSKLVFSPTPKEIKKYHDKQDWLNKINNDGLLICAYYGTIIVGFVICYRKDAGILHIWNAGVLEDYRGMGIWSQMYMYFEKFALENDYQKLTLNTYQKNFLKCIDSFLIEILYPLALKFSIFIYVQMSKIRARHITTIFEIILAREYICYKKIN